MTKHSVTLIIGILIGAFLFGGISAIAVAVAAEPSNWKFLVDGVVDNSIEAYSINGSNYMKVRDVFRVADVGVWYDGEKREVYIETDIGYDNDYNGVRDNYYPEATFISGDVVRVYINPVIREEWNSAENKRIVNIESYERVYEEAFFAKRRGEFSNLFDTFLQLDALDETYPNNADEIRSNLRNMEIISYNGKPYVNIVNIIQYFTQRNIYFWTQEFPSFSNAEFCALFTKQIP